MKKRIMMVIDHYEGDMFKQQNGQLVNNFKNSSIGRALYRQIIGHPRIGIDTKNVDLDIQFFYTKQIPSKNRYTNQYKKPTAKQLRDSYNTLIQRIKQEQPDIVICYGSWFASILAKEYNLNRNDFKPSKLDLDNFVTYVSFCPSPKLFNYMGSYERDTLRIENRMINRFIAGGIESLKPQMGKYKLIKDFNEAKQILTEEVYQHPIVACDFETNTLETYRKGAKAIMMSISWKEHQGVSIPLNHRLEPNLWTKEQFNQLIKWINQLMSSKQWKVFHNGMYDVHMLMDIYGLHKATYVVDTMLMYYEMVDESQGAVRGLKHLSYLYTDMGGYEDTRDQAFQDYLDNYYDKWLATEMEKYKNGERKTKPSHRNYTPPTNPVDGSSIDFEWLPMDVVYPYASADTDVTLQIYDQLKGLVSKRKKWHHLIYEFYPELLDVLAYMQHIGFQVDTDKLGRYRKHFTEDIKDLTQRMYDCTPEIQEYEKDGLSKLQEREKIKKIKPADRTEEQKKLFKEYAKYRGKDSSDVPNYKFNPSSGNKVAYILYKMMGYKLPAEKEYLKPKAVSARKLSHPEKLTWKDYKVDRKSALPYLVKEYNDDLAKLLLQYSSDKKMLTATVEGYSKMLDDTGKLHGRFKIDGTVTSRLASREPNLQNIAKPTSNVDSPNYNYSGKALFKSRFKGGYLLNIDYKSLEVFIATLISKDEGMMQALMDGADIHKRNASIAFDIPIDEVDPSHRQLAKAVTFG